MVEQSVSPHSNGIGQPPMPPRVVITGVGAITPLGLSVDETWQNLLAGKSGIDHFSRFDASEMKTTFGGEVKNFVPEDYLDRKEARRMDPYIQFAMVASAEAVRDAGIDFTQEDGSRVGVIIGSVTFQVLRKRPAPSNSAAS